MEQYNNCEQTECSEERCVFQSVKQARDLLMDLVGSGQSYHVRGIIAITETKPAARDPLHPDALSNIHVVISCKDPVKLKEVIA
jgi:hypothetical protein